MVKVIGEIDNKTIIDKENKKPIYILGSFKKFKKIKIFNKEKNKTTL
jgi:hypothetical protein